MVGTMSRFDVVIIGGGIAGASLAYFLSQRGVSDILILEKEEQPGYHATGRAAGVAVELDFVPTLLELKIQGARFLRNPPAGFSENPLLRRSGILTLFQGELWEKAGAMVPDLRSRGVSVEVLSGEEVLRTMPVVSTANLDGALLLPEDGHMDVHELLWSYLRHAKRSGAELHVGEEVRRIRLDGTRVSGVVTEAQEYPCRVLVNAAGAWASRIREMAGPSPVVLTPRRRTIVTFAPPSGLDVAPWPLTADLSHSLYFSPESSGLLASPMDEDPMEPCDARPDDITVAHTMELLKELAPRLVPASITRKWAGLRTLAPDQEMVVGEDPHIKGFFWLSGQGGAGIETSPAVGSIAADLIIQGRTSVIDAEVMSPARFS
jgi:D-arginine dehydrogenase